MRSLLLVLIAVLALDASEWPLETVTLSLAGESGRHFAGFGVSVSNGGNPDYRDLPAATRARINELLWSETGARVLRLWLDLHRAVPDSASLDLQDVAQRYVTSGLVSEARAAGCDLLLLAPTNIPAHLRADPDGPGHGRMELADDAAAEAYGRVLARALIALHQEHELLVQATGIQNEPSSRVTFTPGQFQLATHALQVALHEAGPPYRDIAIIGPENASVDGTADTYVAALRADSATWAGIAGIAAHSYNMALKPPFAGDWLEEGHSYWNTEAGNTEALPDGDPAPFGRRQGVSLAARALNDLRHGCTHWVWFLGAERATDNSGDQHRLLRYRNDGRLEVLPTYHYYAALAAACPPGSRLLDLAAAPALRAWTHGRKARLHAAAWRTPTDTLTVGLANYSAPEFTEPPTGSDFYRANAGFPAAAQHVHIPLDGVAAERVLVRLTRVGSGTASLPLTTASDWVHTTSFEHAVEAALWVTVDPRELVLVQVQPLTTSDGRGISLRIVPQPRDLEGALMSPGAVFAPYDDQDGAMFDGLDGTADLRCRFTRETGSPGVSTSN